MPSLHSLSAVVSSIASRCEETASSRPPEARGMALVVDVTGAASSATLHGTLAFTGRSIRSRLSAKVAAAGWTGTTTGRATGTTCGGSCT